MRRMSKDYTLHRRLFTELFFFRFSEADEQKKLLQ